MAPPGLLPTDQNGSLAAIAAPLAPNANGSPGGPPLPEGPATPLPSAPPAANGPTPIDPETAAIAAAAGLDPATFAKFPPQLQAAARAAWQAKQDKQQTKNKLEALYSELQDPGWVQKNAGISTKPTDMLRDAFYNMSQLALRTNQINTPGPLSGQPYEPIQQQRLRMAMQLHQQRLADANAQRQILASELGSANSDFSNMANVMKQVEMNQKDQAATADRQAAIAQRDNSVKIMNAYRVANMQAQQGGRDAQANLAKKRAELVADMDANEKRGIDGWQYVMMQPDLSFEERMKLYQEIQIAKNPLASAATVSSRPVQVQDPKDPNKMIWQYMPSYSKKVMPGVPQFTNSGSSNPEVTQPQPGAPATGGAPSRPSVSTGASVAAPPVPFRYRPGYMPNDKAYTDAEKERGLTEKAMGRLQGLYENVDKINTRDWAGFWNGVQTWMQEHPTEMLTPAVGRTIAMTRGLSKQMASYMADFSDTMEDVNLLRKPLGAAGFRGKEGLNLLQGMVGSPMDDQELLKQKWEKLMAQYLVLRAKDWGVKARHDQVPNAPDRDVAPFYDIAAGRDRDKARQLQVSDYK